MGHHSIVKAARSRGSVQVYFPVATVKCEGGRAFRSQTARDLGCLLDANPDVTSWQCMPRVLDLEGVGHVPDFAVFNREGPPAFLDAPDRSGEVDHTALSAAASRDGWTYRLVSDIEVYDGPRLRNVKDLLRYGAHVTALGDRIRVLAALDEQGSLTFAEVLQLFSESKPIAGLASMILHGWLAVDMDEGFIGPETVVRRIRS